MNKYDLTVLVGADVRDEAHDKFVGKIDKQIEALGGRAVKLSELGKKQLAYPINKTNEAIYLNWIVELPAPAVIEFDKKLTVDREVMRHLLVKVD